MFGLYGTPRGRTTGPHHCHQSSTPGPHAGPRSSIPDLALRAQPTLPAGSTLVGSLGSGGVAIPHAHDCELHEETNPSGFGTCASSHPRYDLRMLATISGHRSGSFSSPQCHVDPHPPSRSSTEHPRLGPLLRRGPRLITDVPSPCFVGLPTELAIQHSGAGGYSVSIPPDVQTLDLLGLSVMCLSCLPGWL